MVYSNPVITGHAPDPSIVRVGEDYYLATSSFNKLPGIPIHHSRDLVNWTVIGYAITRPAQYRRDGQDGPIELFAPTLRYHAGTFYLVTTNAHPGQGNLLVTTTDPAGQWSDAIWLDQQGFDPSLFRDDDGAWYYSRRSFDPEHKGGALGPIVTAAINVQTGELGEFLPATPGSGGFVTNDIEGPHIFKRGQWYYLTAAEGSSWKGHMQTLGRSASPWGPFEACPHNPIMTHRDRVGHQIQSLGHADFVEAADGTWWVVALGTRHAPLAQHHNIGRETFLLPVQWTDGGWPVVGDAGTTELLVERDTPGIGVQGANAATEHWLGLRWPVPCSVLGDEVLLRGGALPEAGREAGLVLRPQRADDERFAAVLRDLPEGSMAGVGVYLDKSHFAYAVLQSEAGGRQVAFRVSLDGLETERVVPVAATGEVEFEIQARPDRYYFTVGGEPVGELAARLLSAEAAEWFVATHLMLVHVGEGEARFERVESQQLEPRQRAVLPAFLL
ncbi:family 43 glycosylhydrolase [Glutamicibacter sp. NPDC087344]|uniref:glycoside hydrolase family 43 protein n=1 Tax=Glutamicibacter sp. NPDC087344 TaxID=3363994 RepID=UPI003822FDC3